MNNEYQIFYEYLDELLRVQSKAAEMFEHKGVLGKVREIFLSDQIRKRIDNPLIHTGQIVANGKNVGQADIIIRKKGTINHEIGGQVRITANDTAAVIEVKSNARGTDFRDFNAKAQKIKAENPKTLCGFFTYMLGCKKSTILKRFGVRYDKEYLDFEYDDKLKLVYTFLDFVICIDDSKEEVFKDGVVYYYNKFFFLNRDMTGSDKFDLFLTPPFSGYLISQINRVNNP